MTRWPNAVLQFEDFNMAHAQPLLERYRDHHLVFNDDIQVRSVSLNLNPTFYPNTNPNTDPILPLFGCRCRDSSTWLFRKPMRHVLPTAMQRPVRVFCQRTLANVSPGHPLCAKAAE